MGIAFVRFGWYWTWCRSWSVVVVVWRGGAGVGESDCDCERFASKVRALSWGYVNFDGWVGVHGC
jgi:hypothetical protein